MPKSELKQALGKGDVVKIKDVEFEVKPLNLNDLVTFEELYGAITPQPGKVFKYMLIRLWLYIRKSHPDMTLEQVGDLVDDDNFAQVKELVYQKSDSEDEAKNA